MRKKTAVRAMLVYIVVTAGIWMFLYAYSNSYNKLTEDKIAPASLVVSGESARLTVLDRGVDLDLRALSPDSRLYTALRLLTPDELAADIYLLFRLRPSFSVEIGISPVSRHRSS